VQGLDDGPGRNVPRAPIHDVEHVAVLVDDGIRVTVDDIECPLGILEHHLIILATLWSDLLLALPLPGRGAVTTRL
jgi:hypothetical protein